MRCSTMQHYRQGFILEEVATEVPDPHGDLPQDVPKLNPWGPTIIIPKSIMFDGESNGFWRFNLPQFSESPTGWLIDDEKWWIVSQIWSVCVSSFHHVLQDLREWGFKGWNSPPFDGNPIPQKDFVEITLRRYDPPGRCEYGLGFKLTKLKILGLWRKTGCPPNPMVYHNL